MMGETRFVFCRAGKWIVLLLALGGIAYALSRPAKVKVDLPEIKVESTRVESARDSYIPLWLETNRGEIETRYSPSVGTRYGAILLSGAEGGWGDTADGLYQRLCEELPAEGVACLQLRYRNADDPMECILDVVAAIQYLESLGVDSVALVGYSRGGMIALYAAYAMPAVRTVVTLSTEGVEDNLVARLGPRCSILLMHSRDDPVIPYGTSVHLYEVAQEPKRLVTYSNAGHSLDRVGERVRQEVQAWIMEQLVKE
jgi:alpha/beta superfamily hydrolase